MTILNPEHKLVVKRSVINLQREFGKVIPIEDILRANPEVSQEDVRQALEEFTEEGLVTFLDEDSIQVNI